MVGLGGVLGLRRSGRGPARVRLRVGFDEMERPVEPLRFHEGRRRAANLAERSAAHDERERAGHGAHPLALSRLRAVGTVWRESGRFRGVESRAHGGGNRRARAGRIAAESAGLHEFHRHESAADAGRECDGLHALPVHVFGHAGFRCAAAAGEIRGRVRGVFEWRGNRAAQCARRAAVELAGHRRPHALRRARVGAAGNPRRKHAARARGERPRDSGAE